MKPLPLASHDIRSISHGSLCTTIVPNISKPQKVPPLGLEKYRQKLADKLPKSSLQILANLGLQVLRSFGLSKGPCS